MRIRLLPHRLHADAPFVGKKDENLVGRVFVGRSKEVELIPTANKDRARSVPPGGNKRESSVLNVTHLIRV